MHLRGFLFLCIFVAFSWPASAQNFNQTVVFGDSNVDSGWYKYTSSGNALLNAQIATNPVAGAPTTNPGPMNSSLLASYFGLTANPANAPGGGTNYATSGAKDVTVNNAQTGGFTGAISTVTQMADYLAATGGRANTNALYLINSGANDVGYALGTNGGAGPFPANPNAYLQGAASSLAQSVAQLQVLGARFIIVPDLNYSFPTANTAAGAAERAANLLYSQSLWSDLSAARVNFIPADFNSVRLAILANPSSFGFQFIGSGNVVGGVVNFNGQAACNTYDPSVKTAWALGCTAANLVAPNAEQTHLFADDQHYTTAGQKIEADYYYSLIVAPSEISFLAESAVKARMRFVNATQNQIDVSQDQRGPTGFNAWVTGDVSRLGMDNYNSFPNDPGTPVTLAAGLDFRLSPQMIVGGVISTGTQRSSLGTTGNFTEDEVAGSIYAGYRSGPWWGNVIGTYGHFDYAVTRDVPLGITLQDNKGTTSGQDWSLATEGGYKFRQGWFTHGPVVGLTMQWDTVNNFTEVGSITSLGFGSQFRDSVVSALGYRVAIDLGAWHPFVQAAWDHEFANTDRNVTAFLTTIAAPGYSMPAVVLGKDWGTASLGTTWKLGQGMTALGSITTEFAQGDATTYGVQLGLNIAF